MQSEFVHLHLHTAYSLLDGAIRIPDLIMRATEYNMSAVAITDHGNMFGAIDFFHQMRKAGIKPIIGCEIYITPKSRKDQSQRLENHLVLLAENMTGYWNLVKLVSLANIEGFYYHPRIDYELLEQYHEGLIALSACLGGEIPRAIMAGETDRAREIADRYRNILGQDNFYLEIQRNDIKEQDDVNLELIAMSKELGIPLVATNDCHYLDSDDHKAHEVLLCIRDAKTINDPDRFTYDSKALYFRSGQEMEKLFSDLPEAIRNTADIAKRCDIDLTVKKPDLPQFETPDGSDLDSYLEKKAFEGLDERIKTFPYQIDESVYKDRLREELAIISRVGYSGYFLIVGDFVAFARTNHIPVGPGRGSGAGSLVAYTLGITDLDPIPYNLFFERFLNPDRIGMPDFDIDFCKDRRDEVIEYIAEKYGQQSVGQIATFSTMKAKLVIRDVGRALDIPLSEVNMLAKLIPNELKMTLSKALRDEPRLQSQIQKKNEHAQLFKIAERLEGLNRHRGVHAAGVVIVNGILWEKVPVICEDGHLVTQYAKDDVEKAGLIKFDVLGLKTLTVIDTAQKIINATRPDGMGSIDVNKLTFDDPEVYSLIASGDTYGVFQMESSGFITMLKQMQPNCFADIIAAVALFRPGPMEQIPSFIARKHGREAIHYPHKDLEPILKETHGLIVYQEQVMQISRTMAGFSLSYADILRRAMGKKDEAEMKRMRDIFIKGNPKQNIDGALKRGYTENLATMVFDLMQKFAEYGFNKSHAAGYAVLAYQTAWLKRHHRKAFMAAMMTCDADDSSRIVKSIYECRKAHIKILPPHVNDSLKAFTVVDKGIRFGLMGVRHVGVNAVDAIIKARKEEGAFTSLFDFFKRIDLKAVNKRAVESLIKAGAFDDIQGSRAQLLAVLDAACEVGQQYQHDKSVGQRSIFELMQTEAEPIVNTDPELPDIPELPVIERLRGEKDSLSYFVTGHPLLNAGLERLCLATHTSADIASLEADSYVTMFGIASSVKIITRPPRPPIAFVNFQDMEGATEIMIPPELLKRDRDLVESDQTLVILGRSNKNKDGEIRVVADRILTLNNARRELISQIMLSLQVDADLDKRLYQLLQLIKKYPGNAQIALTFQFPLDTQLELVIVEPAKEIQVDLCDAFIAELEDLQDVEIDYYVER